MHPAETGGDFVAILAVPTLSFQSTSRLDSGQKPFKSFSNPEGSFASHPHTQTQPSIALSAQRNISRSCFLRPALRPASAQTSGIYQVTRLTTHVL